MTSEEESESPTGNEVREGLRVKGSEVDIQVIPVRKGGKRRCIYKQTQTDRILKDVVGKFVGGKLGEVDWIEAGWLLLNVLEGIREKDSCICRQ